MELKTKKGELFFIDDEDYELIKEMTFYKNPGGYILLWCYNTKKRYILHRFILDENKLKNKIVDHINRDKTDNRKSNLRICTPSENSKNRKSFGSSKYLGVSGYSNKRTYTKKNGEISHYESKYLFYASIVINGKQIKLGSFKNEIDAAKKYNEFASKYHGEFANLNIVD